MNPPPLLPDDPYLYRQDTPQAGGARPISQGDVFVEIPLLRAAKPHARHSGQWVSQVKSGQNALGMLVTHPCSSRSRATHALKESVSIAPVTRAPRGFAPPWEGFYEYFPLPRLRDGQDYVADLAAVCPVRADQLTNRRIACLSVDGLAALFHRLTLNSTRLDHVPDHFAMEAQRLSFEIELWEIWVNARGTEEGFQEWLDGEFGGQPFEDAQGHQLLGTEEPTGTTRRDALRWNREEIHRELEQFLARS